MAKFIRSKHLISTFGIDLPEISDNEIVCKIVCPRGDSTFEALNEHEETLLIMLPTKFAHQIFIKKNDFVIVEPASEQNTKLYGTINSIVAHGQLKEMSKHEKWPKIWSIKENEVTDITEEGNPNIRMLNEDKFQLDEDMGQLGDEIESEDF